MDRDGWNARYAAAALVWTAGPNATFVGCVEDLTPGRALDLGAGEGRNTIWLATNGWDATAIDFSEVALSKAEQLAERAGVEVTTVVADVADYEPAAAAFDLVAVIYLHLPAAVRHAVHQRAVAAVAPGGTLVVLGHDTTNIEDGHGGPQDPDVLFSPDDVVDDIADASMTVIRAERVLRTVQTPDGDRSAIDALVVAQRR